MATPFTYLLVAIAGLATVYSTVAVPANALADDLGAGAYAPAELAELLQWHSGLTVTSESCDNPEWKSALSAINPEESMAFRVWHGAEGLPPMAKDGFESSSASFDAPKGDRKSVQGPSRAQ
jgi:hypothetical protein